MQRLRACVRTNHEAAVDVVRARAYLHDHNTVRARALHMSVVTFITCVQVVRENAAAHLWPGRCL
jgi:hypothetical protein